MAAFDGKTVLVTGGGTGVGRAVAEAFGREGALVWLVGRRIDPLEDARGAIEAAGGQARVATCDVSRAEAVDDLAARIAQESAPPDILVNNAGVSSQIVPILKSDPARWTQTMMINVVGPYLMSRRFAPAMVENGWGRIVNVSSAASLAPPFGLGSDYPLSKVALNHFTRQLAAELADSGVTVNAIHPGEVQSEMWRAIRDDAHLRGPEGEGARGWAKLVEDTGGDPPEKAAALVLRLCDPSDAEPATGKFHWIEEGLGKPIPTWD